MKTSIIVRAFNEAEHIERLMLGIGAQTVPPDEVILVDSGSTDDTIDIAHAYGAKVLTIARDEFTFGRALNLGCAAATGEICIVASAHVYPVSSTWLERLIEPFGDEDVALSYGRQRGNETNKFSEHQIFAQWFPARSVRRQTTHFCNNANSAIRRSDWQAAPYDQRLTGLEDLAWAKAAHARGRSIAYVAEAEVVHVHDESWAQVRNRYQREAMALRSIDEHASFTRGDFATLFARNVVSDARSALSQGVLRDEITSILRFRYNQLAGTYRGFNDRSEVSAQLRTRFYYPGGNGRSDDRGQDASDVIDYQSLEARVRHDSLETRRILADDEVASDGDPASEGELARER